MNVPALISMMRRRGTVMGWQHAIPPNADQIDPLTQGPKASLGDGPGPDGNKIGGFGEGYHPEVNIRAYATSKVSAAVLQIYGMIEGGDMELCVVVPFTPDPANGIKSLPADLEAAYNAGEFATIAESETTAAFDRFRFMGRLWVSKGPAVPIIDGNVTVAWRVLITKFTV